jgi:hypothetical protein
MHRAGDVSVRPFRLTAAEAAAARRAINLGRSVLGASPTLWGRVDLRQAAARRRRRNLRQVSFGLVGAVRVAWRDDEMGRRRCDRTQKCTEPVAPSSSLPTDRRRSGCRSESLQPQVLRTRCNRDSRTVSTARQGASAGSFRKLRSFLFTQVRTAASATCSYPAEEEKGAGPGGPAHEVRRAGNAFVHLPDEPSASA